MLNRWILLFAFLIGIGIAFIDSRPTWDDTGVTALALLGSAALLAAVAPRSPWLVGLCIGIWIPAYAIARKPSPGSTAMFLVLLFPVAGAYIGAGLRRLFTTT